MIENHIQEATANAISKIYSTEVDVEKIIIQQTRKEFEGDYTINVFPFLKITREKPEVSANRIGEYLLQNITEVVSYNVIKGFLNILIGDPFWTRSLVDDIIKEGFGKHESTNDTPTVIEYSSPNTNKPLHLGHIRNNLLGWSVAEIMKAAGHEVVKVNLVNDRGIHICKSMLAWEKWFNGKTPESESIKGDKLVGECYVRFDKELKKEIEKLVFAGLDKDRAEQEASLMQEAREMLKKWEENDPAVRELWSRMNEWVYEGFDRTYERLGIDFEITYYESDTFLLGKNIVEEGLAKGILIKKDDGSIWADLSDDGLDEKLLLRADGTSVYMTQDLGTAQLRQDGFHPERLLYVVGNEQNYHFDVLKIILKKLGREWADNITHISYGMVELPHGKMKSREGTVVDADDLMDQMFNTARDMANELGKVDGLSEDDANSLFEMISLGALKFFILRVDPKRNMLFNPEESIDFNGHTGPFIQYTHARIKSLLKKAELKGMHVGTDSYPGEILPKEKTIIKLLYGYPAVVKDAAREYSPAVIANYVYELAREYNQFYQEINILREQDPVVASFRLTLTSATANVISSAMNLLGIDVPEKM
jgi:arginyl-tRNA synthetase